MDNPAISQESVAGNSTPRSASPSPGSPAQTESRFQFKKFGLSVISRIQGLWSEGEQQQALSISEPTGFREVALGM